MTLGVAYIMYITGIRLLILYLTDPDPVDPDPDPLDTDPPEN